MIKSKTGSGYHGFDVYAGKDVTLEEDLQRRDLTINAIAEDANVSKTRFLAAAAHDLLQPLNAAKLFAALLSKVAFPNESPRMPFGTVSQPTSSKPEPTSAPCRNCSGMRKSQPPRSTPTPPRSATAAVSPARSTP